MGSSGPLVPGDLDTQAIFYRCGVHVNEIESGHTVEKKVFHDLFVEMFGICDKATLKENLFKFFLIDS